MLINEIVSLNPSISLAVYPEKEREAALLPDSGAEVWGHLLGESKGRAGIICYLNMKTFPKFFL